MSTDLEHISLHDKFVSLTTNNYFDSLRLVCVGLNQNVNSELYSYKLYGLNGIYIENSNSLLKYIDLHSLGFNCQPLTSGTNKIC